jgi:Cys-rich peptide (Clo7bot family)
MRFIVKPIGKIVIAYCVGCNYCSRCGDRCNPQCGENTCGSNI